MNLIQPKISIIVPVYNVENYVAKCIESIINQSYHNLEIIIINDGSSDKSGDICKYYSKKDNRIILANQNHQGVSIARNNGLDIATGDYIGFVDADDWITLDMFEFLYENLCIYSSDISICNFNYVNESGEDTLKETGESIYNPYNLKIDCSVVLENNEKMINHVQYNNNYLWNKLYKKHLFDKIRFPPNKIFEDIYTTYKLIDNANRIVNSPECKYNYLLRNNSICSIDFTPNRLDIIYAYMSKYYDIKNKYPELEIRCRLYIFTSLLDCIYKAYMENCIYLYKKEINQIVNIVSKNFSIYNCGLSSQQEKLLELLFADIRKYIIAMNINKRI